MTAPLRRELLPCQFCGSGGTLIEKRHMAWSSYRVHCDNDAGCGAAGPIRQSDEAAIEAWNTRAPSPELAAARKTGLDDALKHAQRLAIALHERHYPDVKNWKVADDLILVIDQIDNMTAAIRALED